MKLIFYFAVVVCILASIVTAENSFLHSANNVHNIMSSVLNPTSKNPTASKLFSASSITASKEIASVTFLNSTAVDGIEIYTFQLLYTLDVCDEWDDMDFNGTQVIDEYEISVLDGNIANIISVVVTPIDEFTAASSCVNVVPVVGAINPTFTLLNPDCSGGNSLICNSTFFRAASIPMKDNTKYSIVGDLPPNGNCNIAPTCCLRYTITTIVTVNVTGSGFCPASVPINNCVYVNASLCSCNNFEDQGMIQFKNNKQLGKSLADLSDKETSVFLTEQQCRMAPPVCATACANTTIAPIVPCTLVPPSFNCSLSTDLCSCNNGQQPNNCSYSGVVCSFLYNNCGQSPQTVTFNLTVTPDTTVIFNPTILSDMNCIPNGGQLIGFPGSYVCTLNSFQLAQLSINYCFQQVDMNSTIDFGVIGFVNDLCIGASLPFDLSTSVVIPSQSISVIFDKYSLQTTDFVCPDQSFPQDYNSSLLCKDYVLLMDLSAGCINATSFTMVDDVSEFVALGAIISGPILVSSPDIVCSFNGSAIVCFSNTTILQPGVYTINYTLCFCNCSFCNGVDSKVVPINNTAYIVVATESGSGPILGSITLQSEIICPCYRNCSGCSNSMGPLFVAAGMKIDFHDQEDMGNNITFGQFSTCSLFCPSLNGTTVLGTWERTFSTLATFGGLEWIVAQTTQVSADIGHRNLVVDNSCDYFITCCSTQSQYTCNVTGMITATGNNGTQCNDVTTDFEWNCTLRTPPCPLVPLPPGPCYTLNLDINSPFISAIFALENKLGYNNYKDALQVMCARPMVAGFTVGYVLKNNSTGTISETVTVTSFNYTTLGTDATPIYISSVSGLGWTCASADPIFVPCTYSPPIGNNVATNTLTFTYYYNTTTAFNANPSGLLFSLTAQGVSTSNPIQTVIVSRTRNDTCV